MCDGFCFISFMFLGLILNVYVIFNSRYFEVEILCGHYGCWSIYVIYFTSKSLLIICIYISFCVCLIADMWIWSNFVNIGIWFVFKFISIFIISLYFFLYLCSKIWTFCCPAFLWKILHNYCINLAYLLIIGIHLFYLVLG